MSMPLEQTKHFQIAQKLRRQISDMRAGQALPTLEELKSQFDASQVTVERALQRLRGEGLIHRLAGTRRLIIAEQCDPAQRRVAVIRPDWPSLTYDQLVRSAAEAARAQDWALDLVHYRTLQSLDLARAIGKNDAALLLVTNEQWPAHLQAVLKRPEKPVVVLQDPAPDVSVPAARIHDLKVGQLAVEHLASLGHRHIVALLNQASTPSGLDRIDGWRKAMLRRKLADPEPLFIDCHLQPHQDSREAAYRRFSNFISQGATPFTAVFCTSDSGAMAVLRALREAGRRVPQDVSVVAYAGENQLGPYVNPPLTTVEVNMSEYGRAVVDLLEEQLRDPAAPARQVLIEPYLVERESSGPVPRGVAGGGDTKRRASALAS